MRRLFLIYALALFALAVTNSCDARAQTAPQASKDGAGAVDVNRIVRAFTTKETEFRRALNNYTFTREAIIQTIGFGGQITGEYNRTSQFVFNDAGERFERITNS